MMSILRWWFCGCFESFVAFSPKPLCVCVACCCMHIPINPFRSIVTICKAHRIIGIFIQTKLFLHRRLFCLLHHHHRITLACYSNSWPVCYHRFSFHSTRISCNFTLMCQSVLPRFSTLSASMNPIWVGCTKEFHFVYASSIHVRMFYVHGAFA